MTVCLAPQLYVLQAIIVVSGFVKRFGYAISLHNQTKSPKSEWDIRRIATVWENMRHVPRLPALSIFLLSKNATLSVPGHTHHMNRQVKRSVCALYLE